MSNNYVAFSGTALLMCRGADCCEYVEVETPDWTPIGELEDAARVAAEVDHEWEPMFCMCPSCAKAEWQDLAKEGFCKKDAKDED